MVSSQKPLAWSCSYPVIAITFPLNRSTILAGSGWLPCGKDTRFVAISRSRLVCKFAPNLARMESVSTNLIGPKNLPIVRSYLWRPNIKVFVAFGRIVIIPRNIGFVDRGDDVFAVHVTTGCGITTTADEKRGCEASHCDFPVKNRGIWHARMKRC